MPQLQLHKIRAGEQESKRAGAKTNGHHKIKWDEQEYGQMTEIVSKLAGARPEVPADIVAQPWSAQSIRVLNERYFLKDTQGKVIETVEELCWRVAWEIARAEVKFGKSRGQVMEYAREYYRTMLNRWFLPNSPTLMNAGKDNRLQYSACYVIPVPDSLEGIFDGVKYQGLIHQSGGGTGFSFSRLRPEGSRVKSTMGIASGPVSFMRIYNEATQQIKQGGARRGANMGILRVDHPDIMKFIHCKDGGGITNFNISVAITDKFMDALTRGGEYELTDPHTGEVTQSLSAKMVWEEIADGAWKTGDPGLVFLDRMNQKVGNPIRAAGWEIESTNPCVTGDTLVSTSRGLMRIDKLYEMEQEVELLVDSRLANIPWQKAGRVIRTGEKTVYKLTTFEGYQVRLTEDHQLRTTRGWKRAGDLQVGDKLLIINRKGRFGVEGSLELGQVLGWLVGDGTMKATQAVLSFFGQEKYQLAPLFAQMVDQLTDGMQRLDRAYPVGVSWVDERNEARVRSNRLARLVNQHGIEKGNKLIVPASVLAGSEEMQRGFLQALFTADGHVSGTTEKGVSVRLTSTSHNLLVNVQRLLLNFGIASQIYSNRRDRQLRSLPDGRGGHKDYWCKEYHDLVIAKNNLWKFAEEIGFLVDYKNSKLVDRLRDYRRGPYVESFEVSFESLEMEGKEWVYDLTEPLTHSFIANGLVVHNCGEQQLYPFDACNLGSIFLGHYVTDGSVNWDKLKETTHLAVRFLDSVIEMNPFPLPQITDTVRKIRRIGLGVGGWADMLIKLGIAYDSEEALQLGEQVMKFINIEGHQASQQLAKERGPFPMWKQSVYKDDLPIRNSTVTTIAPTGTIGILAHASSGIEPLFAIAYQHIVKTENRTLTYVNEMFEEVAKGRGFYSEELMKKVADKGVVRDIEDIPADVRAVFGTAHEIHPDWHVRMQAAFQKHTDNSVSKTINMPHDSTREDIKRAYMLAWETDCNGITVFRDGSKGDQVLNLGTNTDKKEEVQTIKPRPIKVDGATYRIETPMGSAFITVNHDPDGNPFEVFVIIGKAGSEVAAMAEALGRMISTTLRFGNHLPAKERAKEIMDQLEGIGGGRSVGFGPNKVRSLPDAVAKALGMHFGLMGYQQKTDVVEQLPLVTKKGDLCPSCGEATFVYEEGCKKCHSCGYSEC